MPGPHLLRPWRHAAHYAALLSCGREAMAWEWLRRVPAYRQDAKGRARICTHAGPSVVRDDREARSWGLHAFEDPDLGAGEARPIWRRGHSPRILAAIATQGGNPEDRFDLGRFASLATLAVGPDAAERVLFSDGMIALRLDIEQGTLRDGPVQLSYLLSGLAAAEAPAEQLRKLLVLCRRGRLEPDPPRARNRRLVLMLRAYDAIQAGASQREIAATLLTGNPIPARWRSEDPSLRLRAQRLVHGARSMVAGGYLGILRG